MQIIKIDRSAFGCTQVIFRLPEAVAIETANIRFNGYGAGHVSVDDAEISIEQAQSLVAVLDLKRPGNFQKVASGYQFQYELASQ